MVVFQEEHPKEEHPMEEHPMEEHDFDDFELVEVLREEGERLVERDVAMMRNKELKVERTIEEAECRAVAAALPRRFRDSRWDEVYCAGRDGFSGKVMFEKVRRMAEGLLVIRDDAGNVFGAFVTDGFARGSPVYYGTNEMFLFTLCSTTLTVSSYPSTGANTALMRVPHCGSLFFGSSPTTLHGLHIYPSLQAGTTAHSDTYANPPLSIAYPPSPDSAHRFYIRSLSVYRLSAVDTIDCRQTISTRTVSAAMM
eukprot:TRINITY_DN22695_c0_g1_i1.p1 TRINITY_DN22695_c0_g1~~TRINITY_DN22695_c0_g1_i1.p1  ORF type:complete len:272 (+),score=54.86 TRINITY_DN22695_c0_g1_i1:56-817(+)